MRRLSIVTLLLCLLNIGPSILSESLLQLNKTAKVSLLTCSAGQELYALFGHCAIRVKDATNKLDKVYNYGTFDFNDPDFYFNFVRGKLLYFLSVTNFHSFKLEYIRANRAIIEQELDLTRNEKQLLFNLLEENNLPQNRHYLYHYFLNNCATKIWEVLLKAIVPTSTMQFKPSGTPESFRQLIGPYLKNRSWLNFGLHLCLGLPCDRLANKTERMFLPLLLKDGFQHASIRREATNQPLIRNELILLKSSNISTPTQQWLTPQLFFWLLLPAVALLSYYFEFKVQSYLIWLDRILFSLVGLTGLFIALLWFATNHDFAAFNFNLLWAMPIHLIFVFKLKKSGTSRSTRHYFFICGLICLLLLVFWPLNPQTLHSALIPILLLITYRCFQVGRLKGK